MAYPIPTNVVNGARGYDANGNPVDANGQPIITTPTQQTNSTPSTLNQAMQNALQNGVNQIGPGNTNQVQGGFQQGAFNSQGTQTQQQTNLQNQVGSQTSQQAQTGTQQNVGTQTSQTGQEQRSTGSQFGTSENTQTGQQQTSQQGQSTTGVVDTLGLGSLLQAQAGSAQATDAARTAYLTDLMQNGGTGYQQQVQGAVNNALSGPTMQGVGDSAQARAAGYAAAQVARTNEDQKLAAAQQLAGGTAATNLVNAGNAYLGQTQATNNTGTSNSQNTANTYTGQTNTNNTSGSSTGTTNTANTTNTSNNTNTTGTSNTSTASLSDLLSSSLSSGQSSAQNAQAAYGTTPQQSSSSGGGGSVVCTALFERGMLPRWMLEEELLHVRMNRKKFYSAAKGYLLWGVPLAKLVRRSKIVALLCLPIAKACTYEAVRRTEGLELPKFWLNVGIYKGFYWFNTLLGKCLPGKPCVRDPEIAKLLSDSGFELDLEGRME